MLKMKSSFLCNVDNNNNNNADNNNNTDNNVDNNGNIGIVFQKVSTDIFRAARRDKGGSEGGAGGVAKA